MSEDNSLSQIDKIYNVYIDEAGHTHYYQDKDQRVLTLAGIITDKDESKFDFHTRQLLTEYKLPQDTEVHTTEIFSRKPKPPFDKLDNSTQQELVYRFLKEGFEYTDYVHFVSPIKSYVKPHVRIGLEKRNLDLYLYTLFCFAVELDFYFFKTDKGKYRLIFDKNDDFPKRTKKMIEELSKASGSYYSLKKIAGPPEQLDSKCSRFIQLADAACWIYTRYRQFEVKTLKKPENLMKYEEFYKRCYLLVKDKLLPFLKLYLDGIFGESPAILDFKEFETRDFNHMGNWLYKKKNPDIFDPTVNTFWEVSHLEMKEQVLTLENILDNSEKIFTSPKVANQTAVPAVISEIVKRFQDRMKNINRDNKGWEQEFPEAKRGVDLLEDFSKKITEKDPPPNTDLKNQLLVEEIADQIELGAKSEKIQSATELEQLIKRNKYYFNKIISTMYLFIKINYNTVKRMIDNYVDKNDSQSTWKNRSMYAKYLKSYTEEINALDEDIFESYEKVVMTLKIMILKISLFNQIQLEKQKSFRSDLINLNMVLSVGISQYKAFLKGLKHCMNILEEAHYAFNSMDNLLKKVVKLKSYTQELIDILNTNKASNNSEKSIEGSPVNKKKILSKKVKMRIPGSRKKKKRNNRK